MASTTFMFIDTTTMDASTRRQARSHAMKGKNVGKKHLNRRTAKTKQKSAPSRIPKVHDLDGVPSSSSSSSSDSELQEDSGIDYFQAMEDFLLPLSPVLRYQIRDDVVLPVHLTTNTSPQGQQVIRQFFSEVTDCLNPPALCSSPERVNRQWLSILFNNDTSYHCTMALMGTLNQYFFGRETDPSSTMSHLTQAVVLVNQSLDTPDALSDSNIYTVNFMVVHELLNGEKLRALVHLKGLQKMVELRGGISALELNTMLLCKVCKTDIDVSLHFGTPPCFSRDQWGEISNHMASCRFVETARFADLDCYPLLMDINPYLQQVFLDMSNATAFFNQGYRIDPHLLQEAIVSSGYRLVRFQPMGGALLRGKMDSVCHAGLTALATTMFFQIGRRRFMQYELVGRHLKDVVDTVGVDDVNPDVRLWLLFVGGVSVVPEREEKWLQTNILDAAQAGGVKGWDDVHRRLLRFPWISSLFDVEAEKLWYASLGMALGG